MKKIFYSLQRPFISPFFFSNTSSLCWERNQYIREYFEAGISVNKTNGLDSIFYSIPGH